MAKSPELKALQIVLLGRFNPAIFHPIWFEKQQLLNAAEVEAAQVEVIHRDVSVLRFEWFQLQVFEDRCEFSCIRESHFQLTKDLAQLVFQLLEFTPVSAMGINVNQHFRVTSEDGWHRIGHRLAPKEVQDPVWNGLLEKPGLRVLRMEGARPDGLAGYVWVTVEPSRRFHPGVYVSVNDHYDLDSGPKKGTGADVPAMLEARWEESIRRAQKIADSIIELA